MGFIDKTAKAIRLLVSRRYTHNALTDAQEAFTNTFDLNASEIYANQNLIPTSSLPFSGSSQHLSTYTTQGKTVLKYWYRHKLTKSNVNNEVWFFLNPTGSDSGIGAQLIDDNQQVNFISPKYSISSLANSVTEDATPGYGVVVYVSSAVSQSIQTGSLEASEKVSSNNYAFDYKTGVLQFSSSAYDPSDSQYTYITTYQYVGETLEAKLNTLETDTPFSKTGSYFSTHGNLKMTGSVDISGSLTVRGQTLMDSLLSGSDSLIVSGAMTIAKQTATNAIQSASITIGNLGTFATPEQAGIIDLGDRFN
jgi:hypothetical protein|tara:strand:- start:322 stop:1245 length:924 start_codon:yes stop_codon:yes gene_type:complete